MVKACMHSLFSHKKKKKSTTNEQEAGKKKARPTPGHLLSHPLHHVPTKLHTKEIGVMPAAAAGLDVDLGNNISTSLHHLFKDPCMGRPTMEKGEVTVAVAVV
jgi:hypothetical protein